MGAFPLNKGLHSRSGVAVSHGKAGRQLESNTRWRGKLSQKMFGGVFRAETEAYLPEGWDPGGSLPHRHFPQPLPRRPSPQRAKAIRRGVVNCHPFMI